MKKLLCILMVCLLALTLCAPALAEESEPLVGGWTPTEGDPAQIPRRSADRLCQGHGRRSLEGCTYTPVALLAAQVVAGTNYCLLCRDPDRHPGRPRRLRAGVFLRGAGRQRPSAEGAGDRVFRL